MELINFTSLLEIYAVFAFAYVGLDNFQTTINNKIFTSSKILEDCITEINNKFQTTAEVYSKVVHVSRSIDNTSKSGKNKEPNLSNVFEETLKEFLDEKSQFEEEQEQLFERIAEWKRSAGFNKICLFSAIYCIVCLYVSGAITSFNEKLAIYLILIIASFIHVILSIALAVIDVNSVAKKIKSVHIILFWIIFVLISLFYYFNSYLHLSLDNLAQIKTTTILFIILTPTSQYFTYFFRFLYVHKKSRHKVDELVENYSDSANEQEIKSENYRKLVDDLVDANLKRLRKDKET